ncbi:hypothetical protein Tco_0046056 [Tanacetum coccineum]
MEEMNRNLTRVLQTNQQVNTVTPSCETCGGPHSYNDYPATVGKIRTVHRLWEPTNQGGIPTTSSNPSSLLPPFHNSLSGSTTSSSPSLHLFETSDYSLEEFVDELAHITFPPGNDDLPLDANKNPSQELEYCLTMIPIKDMNSILKIRLMKIS